LEEEAKYSHEELIWIQNNIGWLDYDKTHHPDSFRWTQQTNWLVNCDCSIILLAMGNQTGKTDMCAEDWCLRIHGLHPVSWKNLKNTDKIRTFRVCAETLPTEKGGNEKKNTVYQAIMRRFPTYLLKNDITLRNPVQAWKSPVGGPDFFIEYVSYGQTDQRQAGVQRKAILIDEGAGNEFFIEQTRRITAAEAESGKADIIIAYTPTETESAWMFDDILERAKVIYRTPTVCRYIFNRSAGKEKHKAIEYTENDSDIAVIFSSLLDNPVFPMDVKIKKIKELADPDVQAARGFGLFRQASGKVFKDFNSAIHVKDFKRYFINGIPDIYKLARGIDYHSKNPWACIFIAISPWDEIFVWDEYEAFPDKMITYDIGKIIAAKSGHYNYAVSKIDPLAGNTQTNTGLSPLQDLNRYFYDFKKEGLGTGGNWTPWDTKSSKGLDELRKRLYYANICKEPFNNLQIDNGKKVRVPTIWFGNNCIRTIEMMKKWKWQDWKDRDRLTENDPKGDNIGQRQQRYSHFPITIECLLKCPEVVMARFKTQFDRRKVEEHKSYFQAGR
jgi:hypothetical protein